MKATTLKKAAVFAGSLSFLAGSAFSQQAFSGVGGYRTVNIDNGFNLVGVNLHNPVLVSGAIDTETDADVGDSTVDYTTILTDADATYVFEVLDGAQAGAIAEITAAANGSVTVDGAIGAGVGSAYSIRQAPSLNDTFGDLAPGFTAVTADVVYVPTGVGGGYDTYFQHQLSGQFRPTTAPGADPAKPVSWLYSDGVLVERKTEGPLALVITGMVKTTGTIVNVPSGFGAVAVSAPVGSELNDENGLKATINPGFTAVTADVVYVPAGAPGAYDTYFVHQLSGNFRSTTSPGADADPLPINNAVLVERKGDDTAGLLGVPAFYENL